MLLNDLLGRYAPRAIVVLLLACPSMLRAQSAIELGTGMAIMDTLGTQQAAPGPGFIDRARGAAAGARGPMSMDEWVAMGNNPDDFNPGVAAPGGVGGTEFGEFNPEMMGGPMAPIFEYIPPKVFQAIEGRRIYDAVSFRLNPGTARILDDPRRIKVLEDATVNYSDDGRTLGDQEANDGLFSSIETTPSTEDQTGGLSHYYASKIMNMLSAAEELDPLQFYGLIAMTKERFSEVSKEREKILDRNAMIYKVDEQNKFVGSTWAERFLDLYRLEQGNPESPFFPLYIPRPPAPPAVAPPTGWMPPQGIKSPEQQELEAVIQAFTLRMESRMTKEELDAAIKGLRARYRQDPTVLTQFIAQYLPNYQSVGTGVNALDGGTMMMDMDRRGDGEVMGGSFGENSRGYFDSDGAGAFFK
jgi:hypothetical protein